MAAYTLFGADRDTGALPPKVRAWVVTLIESVFDAKLATALTDGTIGSGVVVPPGGGTVAGGYDGGDLGTGAAPSDPGYDGGTL